MNSREKLFRARMRLAQKSKTPRSREAEARDVFLASMIPFFPASAGSSLKRIPQTQAGQIIGSIGGTAAATALAKRKGFDKQVSEAFNQIKPSTVIRVGKDHPGNIAKKVYAGGKHAAKAFRKNILTKKMLPYYAIFAGGGALGSALANYIGGRGSTPESDE